VLLDVFEDGGSQLHLAGEGCDEQVVGDHRLRVADAVVQPGSGGAGEDKEDVGEDRIPA
jgi:hypothetical protein